MRRLLAMIVLAWVLGFVWFASALPRPAGDEHTDGVVVLTGGGGRIPRGIEALNRGWATRLLVSGVAPEVRPAEFAARYRIAPATMRCCVTLGYQSVDTRSNATETARWAAAGAMRSLRLVTTDWHMRRARWEIAAMAPPGLRIVPDAVPSTPSLRALFLEYNKLLARRAAAMIGL